LNVKKQIHQIVMVDLGGGRKLPIFSFCSKLLYDNKTDIVYQTTGYGYRFSSLRRRAVGKPGCNP
jgi:hypothetical protein